MAEPAKTKELDADGPDFGGWVPSGRKTVAPDSELIELENPDGDVQHAIVFPEQWHHHERLTTDVQLVETFMAFPMVEGLSCLSRAPTGSGIFQYDTGHVVPLGEVIRHYRDRRKKVGVGPTIELLRACGSMLAEAAQNGPMHGIYSHNGLTPWRVVLGPDGTPQIIGYGLPQMDIVAMREDADAPVREVSFHYCPPERLTSGYEDISSDIYALALMAFELITGEPLLKGKPSELKGSVALGEGLGLMKKAKDVPKALRDILVRAMAFDPIGRYDSAEEFVEAIAALPASLSKGSLAEVAEEVWKGTKRGAVLARSGAKAAGGGARTTRLKSASEAKPVRGAPRGRAPAKPDSNITSEGRWGKVAREEEEEEETPTAERTLKRSARREESAEPPKSRKPRRKGRGRTAEEPPAEEAATPPTEPAIEESEPEAEEKPKRRSRARKTAEKAAPEPVEQKEDTGRRRRSKAKENEASQDDAPKETTKPASKKRRTKAVEDKEPEVSESKPAADDPPQKRTRRSRATSDAEDEAPAQRARRSRSTDSDDSAPKRSRRTRASDDDSGDSARASLRRSRASDDDDDAPKTRSRRRSTSSDDEDDKPKTRSRRTRASDD